MTMHLTANISKPGALCYLARRVGEAPPASAQALLQAVASNSRAAANFTGSLEVPAADTLADASLCIADGDDMVVYAVAQDEEGTYAGRWPNNSTMIRCGTHAPP